MSLICFPSSHLVELARHSRLLMSCIVLVQKPLAGCAVDSLNSNFIGTDGFLALSSLDLMSLFAEDLMLAMLQSPPPPIKLSHHNSH